MSVRALGRTNTFTTSSPFPLQKAKEYMGSKFYRTTREIQNNTTLNRATLELLGADLPSTVTELVGRNWKTAVEVAFRITLYLAAAFFIPLLFVPVFNKMAKRKFDLPAQFNKNFSSHFEDLLPEKNTKNCNEQFKQKLVKLEGKEKVEEYLGNDVSSHDQKVNDYKQKLIKAKSYVVKLDVLFSGLLTYLVPWTQVWFSKKVLGVVGYTGELDLLDESQREQSTQFHEKTKYIKFGLGTLLTIFGSNWYSDKVYKAATKPNDEIKGSKFMTFLKKNIKQFDYYKQIYANKLNLAGTFLFGVDAGYLLSCRSLNEIIERVLRLAVAWPTMFFGVEWVNYKLCENHDKKHGSGLVDYNAPKELGVRQVKSLEKLEEELHVAENENNEEKIKLAAGSIKTQVKNYWYSILLDSLLMGVGLTAANIIGTKIRVSKGIY